MQDVLSYHLREWLLLGLLPVELLDLHQVFLLDVLGLEPCLDELLVQPLAVEVDEVVDDALQLTKRQVSGRGLLLVGLICARVRLHLPHEPVDYGVFLKLLGLVGLCDLLRELDVLLHGLEGLVDGLPSFLLLLLLVLYRSQDVLLVWSIGRLVFDQGLLEVLHDHTRVVDDVLEQMEEVNEVLLVQRAIISTVSSVLCTQFGCVLL